MGLIVTGFMAIFLGMFSLFIVVVVEGSEGFDSNFSKFRDVFFNTHFGYIMTAVIALGIISIALGTAELIF